MLLNDGGYDDLSGNVTFPVEVSGTKSVASICFIVHRDELARVGVINPTQWPIERWFYWFIKGTEAEEINSCE
jgi:hypothetical protein